MTALLLLIALGVDTQTSSRDTQTVATVAGTSVIAGQVVTDDATARPIRLAKVEVTSSALRRQMMTVTDAEGRFVFSRLPAGRYSLTVSKPGFATTLYGARRPGGAGVPIVVAEAEQIGVTVSVARGAVISGTVRDANGEPASDVIMQVMEYGFDSNGVRTLQNRSFSNSGNGLLRTDDRGNYRIYGLRPGEYFVQASPTFSSVRGRMTSAAEIEWAQRAINAPGAELPAGMQSGQNMTLAPVLYPGTLDPAAALPVTVKAGEERNGVDFALALTPTATVSGIVRGPDGSPPKLAQATLRLPNAFFGQAGSSLFIRPDAEGRFSVSNVLPGDYVLAARGSMETSSGPGTGFRAEASMPLWAMTEVAVSGQDVSGLELTLLPGLTVSGKLTFDGTTAPPADLSRISVSLTPQNATAMGAPDVLAKADGTFVIPGVGPGEYRFFANIPPSNGATSPWSLRSATLSGTETLDVPLSIRTDLGGAVITFTDHPTELTGSLLDTNGKPALEYFIVVFSADRSFWTPASRRVRSVRPGNTGSYRIANLPPGDYYLCVMTDVDTNLLNTTAYLEQLVGAASKLTLAEGEKKAQDFKIAR